MPKTAREKELETVPVVHGEKQYFVDMKENQYGPLVKLVEVKDNGKKSRIAVPLSNLPRLVATLSELYQVHLKTPIGAIKQEVQKSADGSVTYPSTVETGEPILAVRRKIYMDLKELDGSRMVRISTLVQNNRRINIQLAINAVPDVLKALENYNDKYAKRADEFKQAPRRKEQNRQANNNNSANPNSSEEKKARAERIGLKSVEQVELRKIKANDNKSYNIELVSGGANFVRINEFVNDRRKSTIHLPTAAAKEFSNALKDFVAGIPAQYMVENNANQ